METTPLRLRRIEQKLTQREVAEKARITSQYYQRVEAGLQIPTAEIAVRIASVLEVTVEELWPMDKAS